MKQLYSMAKKNATAALRENWGKAVAVLLITLAISILFTILETVITVVLGIPSFVDYLGTPGYFLDDIPNSALPSLLLTAFTLLAALVVLSPLGLGVKNWYLTITYGSRSEIGAVFAFFETFGRVMRSIGYSLSLAVRKILWGTLFFSPAMALGMLTGQLSLGGSTELDGLLVVAGGLLTLCLGVLCAIFFWIFLQRYFLVGYILCIQREVGVGKAIRLSVAATSHHKTDIALFQLSFFGWLFPALLVLPILYIQPYWETSMALYGRYLLEKAGIARPAGVPTEEGEGELYYLEGPIAEL